MKLLTENLPQSELLMFCRLFALTTSDTVVTLLTFDAENLAMPAENASPDMQVITTTHPDRLPDITQAASFLYGLWQAGESLVIEDIQTSKKSTAGFWDTADFAFQSMILHPIHLTIPAGFMIKDSLAGSDPKGPDGNEMPALHRVDYPALICLMGTQSRVFTSSEFENVKTVAHLLTKFIHQWTDIQHEQQKLRKLRHDLRTPLTSMTMLPDLMKSTPSIDKEMSAMCDQVMIAARKLDQILANSDQDLRLFKSSKKH